ncbi:MAG: FAD-dependent oxidoreductase [Planctomycetota bacterium]
MTTPQSPQKPKDSVGSPTPYAPRPTPSPYDLAVLGAGIAGCTAAATAAQAGASVILLEADTFPRDKVCGGCLNAHAQHALHAAGLTPALDSLNAPPVTTLTLHNHRRSAQLALPANPPTRAVSRADLDLALLHHCQTLGVTTLTQTPAQVTALHPTHTDIQIKHTSEATDINPRVTARVTLVATGLAGQPLTPLNLPTPKPQPTSHLGLNLLLKPHPEAHGVSPWTIPPNHLLMATAPPGMTPGSPPAYAGAVTLNDGRLDLAAALPHALLKQHPTPNHALLHLLQQTNSPLLNPTRLTPGGGTPGSPPDDSPFTQALLTATPRLTPKLTRTRTDPAHHRLLILGDAAGYLEPFTGEGMAWAAAAGHAAAQFALAHLTRWSPATTAAYQRLHHLTTRARQRRCRALVALLRRPRLTDATLRLLQHAPLFARPLTYP